MLLAEVVTTSAAVAATRSRKVKVALLQTLLSALAGAEIEVVAAWLAGEPRQGRLGVGWGTLKQIAEPPASAPSLDVLGVDAALTGLTQLSGAGSAALRKTRLSGLMAAATQAEQEFLLRLLLGDLRQGALEGVMTEAIAAASGTELALVRRALMLSGSLPATAVAALNGGDSTLAQFRLQVGRAVRPMLASPAESLAGALEANGAGASVEYKLDGARIQLHRHGTGVWVFTRTLRDITASVPEIVAVARELDCDSAVLDGESLAITDSGRPRPFQETMSRFGASAGETVLRPYFFDCLELNGQELLDAPLAQRQQALEQVAGEYRIPTVTRPSVAAAEAHYADALAAGHEGVMVKSLDAPYLAGRRGRGWLKIKPEHTLDLIVLGAEWGYGRRTGYLSNLHLGARDPDGGAPVMVGKTFKGLTDELLRWQTSEFPRYERETDGHTVYLRPELVVEIELDGVQVSSRYPGGVALRFARVKRYRPDKLAGQADTIDNVRRLLAR